MGGIAANTLSITDFNGGLATLETAGVTAGFAFPMYGAKQLPRYINIMLAYGKRGLNENILIQENYYNISFSFTFNNKFTKRKAGI